MQHLKALLSSSPYMPHGYCFLWNPGLVGLHVISDSLIALSYLSIPFTLGYFVRKRRDLPFHWMFLCFGVFILERPWNAWVLDQRSPSSHDGKCNAQSRIRICFSLPPKNSTYPSQGRWLWATVCGICWQPGERAVLGWAYFRAAMAKKNCNR